MHLVSTIAAAICLLSATSLVAAAPTAANAQKLESQDALVGYGHDPSRVATDSNFRYQDISDPKIKEDLLKADDAYRSALRQKTHSINAKLASTVRSRRLSVLPLDNGKPFEDEKYMRIPLTQKAVDRYGKIRSEWQGLKSKGDKIGMQDEARMKDLEKEMAVWEKVMGEENAELYRRADAIKSRFGKFDAKTGTFEYEKRYLKELGDAIASENPTKLETPLDRLGGIDVAKEYMRNYAYYRKPLGEMYEIESLKSKSAIARFFHSLLKKLGLHSSSSNEKLREDALEKFQRQEREDLDSKLMHGQENPEPVDGRGKIGIDLQKAEPKPEADEKLMKAIGWYGMVSPHTELYTGKDKAPVAAAEDLMKSGVFTGSENTKEEAARKVNVPSSTRESWEEELSNSLEREY